MNGYKNETAIVPLVHRKSTIGYTEMFWMKPFTSPLFLSFLRYLFFNRIKLSSFPLLRRSPIFPSYDICLKVAAECPILSLFPATKTPSSFSLILFAYSTDADTCDNFFFRFSLCFVRIGLAAVIPTWCLIFVPLNINSNFRSVFKVNRAFLTPHISCLQNPLASNNLSVLDFLFVLW